MQVVSSGFSTHVQKTTRIIKGKVEIDWQLSGTFDDESPNKTLIEVERKVNEPLGGISISLANVTLTNHNDRYTPPATT